MTLSNSSELLDTPSRHFDLIIIGSGPAGMTIARELSGSGLDVALLESGGNRRSAMSSELNRFESVGHQRKSYEISRCRGIGGTSQLWTGQCGVFDEIDYHARDWVPFSGWPIDSSTLQPYFNRAGAYLGIKETISTDRLVRELTRSFDYPSWDRDVLSQVGFQISRNTRRRSPLLKGEPDYVIREELMEGFVHHVGSNAMDFGSNLVDDIASSDNVHLFTDATVIEVLSTLTGAKVEGVRIKRFDGKVLVLEATAVVVACGGIENARLLLASRKGCANGLGNENDQVGRFLADHPSATIAEYRNGTGRAVRRRLGGRWHSHHGNQHIFKLGPRLSPELQARENLLNAAYTFVEWGGRRNALSTLVNGLRGLSRRDLSKRTLGAILAGVMNPIDLARASADRFVRNAIPLNHPELSIIGCFVEQQLNPESRVTLSDETDFLGQNLSRIDWRISEAEYRTCLRAAEIFYKEMARCGYETPMRPDWMSAGFEEWKSALSDRSHPMCSTRMSDDPRNGVVDADCKVHGVEGLFISGGSVFSTPGFMNPTQMIVALSIRLAETLKNDLKKNSASPTQQITDAKPLAARASRIAFVGGGHRVLNVYKPVISALGDAVEVVGAITRSEESAQKISSLGWRGSTSLETILSEEKPDFLIASVPNSKLDALYPKLVNHGVPLLFETPVSWSVLKGRKLVQQIHKTGTLVGVAEQYPLLPLFQLWKKVIDLGVIGTPVSVVNDFSIYSYHGIAVLRTLLGRDRREMIASGMKSRLGSEEDWTIGTVKNVDQSLVSYNYSAAYARSEFRPKGTIRVVGTTGTLFSTGLMCKTLDGGTMTSEVNRNFEDGRLTSLDIDTPLGKVRWQNDFGHSELTDEQIASAYVVRGMLDAVRNGGVPLYSAAEALVDMEFLNAMNYSANRNGASVRFPYSVLQQRVLSKLSKNGA